MIKTIITMVLLLLSKTSFAQTQAKVLVVDIRGVGCRGGSGLCSVMPENSKENNSKIIVIPESFNTISLIIDASQLTLEEQQNYLGKEYSILNSNDKLLFTQEGDYVFDKKSLIYLGLDTNNTTLKKGSYPCVINKNRIQVKMTLVEN